MADFLTDALIAREDMDRRAAVRSASLHHVADCHRAHGGARWQATTRADMARWAHVASAPGDMPRIDRASRSFAGSPAATCSGF